MFKLNRALFPVVACSLLTLASLETRLQPAQSQSNDAQAKISDANLQNFFRAYVQNQKIRETYEPQLADTTDPQTWKQMQDQANAELKNSLAKQHLSIDEYNRIYNAINNDEQLRARALKLVEEERQRSLAEKAQRKNREERT